MPLVLTFLSYLLDAAKLEQVLLTQDTAPELPMMAGALRHSVLNVQQPLQRGRG